MTRRRRLVLVTALLAVVLTAGSAAAAVTVGILFAPPDPDGVTTLLLLGSDAGPPRGGDPRSARADAFHLLFVSEDRRYATFINIPRDAYVPVPGRGRTRINACLNGGPERCVRTVESIFDGVEVDGYLLTSMRALTNAFDDFGGLVVDVDQPLYDGGADIRSPGEQRLTGGQILTYARDRKNRSGGDFARSRAQSEVLALAHRQVAQDGTVDAVMSAVTILRRHTVTDLSTTAMVRYAFDAMRVPPDNVRNVTLSGRGGRAGAASVVFLNDSAYTTVADAAADGRA